ncbi:hypothetical protein E2C01_079552 [Portunus trituberculatus]|uniref:Uncharacterized protein n=1 Tax=Portunus trituberculatus TaxID=210409 RepID=A0A5B7ILT2_PORTR|nr:hypothetical protein [Portunus trituberculatus]
MSPYTGKGTNLDWPTHLHKCRPSTRTADCHTDPQPVSQLLIWL